VSGKLGDAVIWSSPSMLGVEAGCRMSRVSLGRLVIAMSNSSLFPAVVLVTERSFLFRIHQALRGSAADA
jgi:hypothetical protein